MKYLLVLMTCIAAANPAVAQDATSRLPDPGSLIRVETIDGGLTVGQLEAAGPDSLAIGKTDGYSVVVPLGAVRRVDAWGRNGRLGAKRGFLAGAGLGVVALAGAVYFDLTATAGSDIMIPVSVVAIPVALALPFVGAGVGYVLAAPMGWVAVMRLPVPGPVRR